MSERGEESAEVGRGLLEQEAETFKLWHEVRDARMSGGEFQLSTLEIKLFYQQASLSYPLSMAKKAQPVTLNSGETRSLKIS
jgi:hypothetical protein